MPSPISWVIRHRLSILWMVLLSAVILAEAHTVRQTKSITFDETYYLNCGLQTVHDRWIDPRIAAEGIAPLPVLLTYVPALALAPREFRPEPWKGRQHDRHLIDGPRFLNTLVIGLPLMGLVFAGLLCRRDLPTACLGSGLLALSPTFMAHASLATMDAAFALFSSLALATTAWYLQEPNRWRFGLWGLSIAAALSAKYSSVFLLPMSGLLLFFSAPTQRSGWRGLWEKLLGSLKTYGKLLGLVLPLWWGLHGFTFTGPLKNVPLDATPDSSPWVQMLGRSPTAEWFMDLAHERLKRPAPVSGVVFQYLHNKGGHGGAYLWGQRFREAKWEYYPCAFLYKSTPVELLLAALLLGGMLWTLHSPTTAWKDLEGMYRVMLIGAGVFVALVMTANINIGQRYLILLYPLLCMAGSDRLAVWLKGGRWAFFGIGGLLLAVQLVSNLSTTPDHLAYFNRWSGGSENGWRLLSDSNLDWGQDLPGLAEGLAREEAPRTALSYFGTAVVAGYGISADRLDRGETHGDYELLAVSVNHLQGMYIHGEDPFREWRDIPPDWKSGESMWVYRLDTTDRKRLLQTSAERIRQGLLRQP